ncbi:hypothetical protein [Shewanella sp.]|jgi:hypothetical protein|uniref:hypothetical protein n=1 Tax=Shewanella sp. TaxID=50422 RepID=UPI0035626614
MANEYFKLTQIWQRFRKGLRQYPFSICEFAEVNPGSNDTVIGVGMVPDGEAIHRPLPFNDEHEASELSLNGHVDPPYIYDGSVGTGLKESM